MMAPKLACPSCRRTVPEVYWQDVEIVRCPSCANEFEQLRFPALTAPPRVAWAALPAGSEATCFFHAHNRAEAACDGCGRYVCAVCRVPVAGQHYCPACLEGRAERRKLPENHRVLYGHIALVLAILPLLLWPITLLTAPASIGFVIAGWKKPGSLVRKWRKHVLIIACIIASLEVAVWIFVFGAIILK